MVRRLPDNLGVLPVPRSCVPLSRRLACCGSVAATTSPGPAACPRETRYPRRFRTQGSGIPGLALAVIHGDSVLALKGYGVRSLATRIPVRSWTIFGVGSLGRQVVSLAAFLVSTQAVDAQSRGRVALSIAHPSAVGIVWHVKDRFALRPDFSFSRRSSDSPPGTISRVWTATIGLSALVYLFRSDSLQGYIAQRASYSKTDGAQRIGSEAYTLGEAFGLQYALGRRFAVFGETGLQYSWSSVPVFFQGVRVQTTHTRAWETTAGVGLMFYVRR